MECLGSSRCRSRPAPRCGPTSELVYTTHVKSVKFANIRDAGESGGVAHPTSADSTFTFAQLSDPHLSSLHAINVRDLLNKRILGYLSWRLRRRVEHSGKILAALHRDLSQTRPAHIVVTGDLTHVGLPSEFREARDWLHHLGPPSEVTLIPGNHDAYVATAWDDTFALWAPYMVSDACGDTSETVRESHSLFPSLRVRGDVALVGLCTARPSAPFLAVGTIGRDQLDSLDQILEETGRRNLFRIVLMHHPPSQGTVAWRKRLTDGAALRAVLARRGAELLLHGHTHQTSIAEIRTPTSSIPSLGIPSASAQGRKPGRRARYHVYRITRADDSWDILVSARGYSPARDQFIAEGDTHLTVSRSPLRTA